MELPNLGRQCSETTCRQLDFLPMKCDACSKIFCKDHLQYDDHNCGSSYKKNIQVPVCPLCSQPIPVSRGTVPDLAVSAHIENNCEVRSKEKVFSNKCNKAKCKKKELVPCVCNACRLNFCLTHRHPADHDCKGPQVASRAAAAATSRARESEGQFKISNFFSGPFKQPSAASTAPSSRPSQSRPPMSSAATAALNRQSGRGITPGRPLIARAENGGMSEDEALAAALAASMSDPAPGEEEDDQDRMLALALQESERMAAGRRGQTAGGEEDKSCSLQ